MAMIFIAGLSEIVLLTSEQNIGQIAMSRWLVCSVNYFSWTS